jgi:hypothetical protein
LKIENESFFPLANFAEKELLAKNETFQNTFSSFSETKLKLYGKTDLENRSRNSLAI